MDIASILEDKTQKSTEKRKAIASAIKENVFIEEALETSCNALNEKQITVVMEAIEEITREESSHNNLYFLTFAKRYISTNNNSLKREAARVIGNLAGHYSNQMADVIPILLENAKDSGTVIRWSGAYALARIVCLPEYAVTSLYEKLTELCESEDDNGIKNQYLGGLKKAKKFRKEC